MTDVIGEWILETIRTHPGIRADELREIFGDVSPELRRLHAAGMIETSEGRYWTDCECWERVRRSRYRLKEVSSIMTNEKDIDAELRSVPVPEPVEATEEDQYLVDYVQAYAAQSEAGDWQVHIAVVYDGYTTEIVLSANDAKALSGGVAMANSLILRERTKDKFARKRAPKTAE